MSGRLLALNVPLSGINSYLFGELQRLGWEIECFDVPIPFIFRMTAALLTFHPIKKRWSARYYGKIWEWLLSPRIFRARTRICERYLQNAASRYDIAFQIGGLFAPSRNTLDKPYVTFNDFTFELSLRGFPELYRRNRDAEQWIELEKRLYRGAARVFTASENTRQSMMNHYGVPAERVVAVGEGLKYDRLPSVEDKVYDGRTLIFVGFQFERKGGLLVLEALRRLRFKYPDLRLVVVGTPKLYDVAGVEWVGKLDQLEVLSAYYRTASVFVMPSYCEAFGLVFLEAMAHKLPCIGSKNDAMPEIIVHDETGFVIERGNVDELCRYLERLIGDPKLMARMGEAGYRRVMERYTWPKVAAQIGRELRCLLPHNVEPGEPQAAGAPHGRHRGRAH